MRDNVAVCSPQTLSEADRRVVAAWAAECAERVLPIFEAEAPNDERPRDAIRRVRAFSRGELGVTEEIRRRFIGRVASGSVSPAAVAAARSAGQAAAVAHMGAHALGAAGYATKAVALAAPERQEAVDAEIAWQVGRMSSATRAALLSLPALGEDRAGPLGPGLLASGSVGAAINAVQAHLQASGST